jgi:hypothetical protein
MIPSSPPSPIYIYIAPFLDSPKCRNPSHCELLCVLNVSVSSFTALGLLWKISCLNGARLKQGTRGRSSAQSVAIRIPCWISRAAASVFAGVRRFSIPSSSEAPKRPHALPRGPSFWRGRAEKGGGDGGVGDAIGGDVFLGGGMIP